MATHTANQDPDDLESLFDSILAANNAENKVEAKAEETPATSDEAGGKMLAQIGQMAHSIK